MGYGGMATPSVWKTYLKLKSVDFPKINRTDFTRIAKYIRKGFTSSDFC